MICGRILLLKTGGIDSTTVSFRSHPVHVFLPLLSMGWSSAGTNFCRRGHGLYPYPMSFWWECGYLCHPYGTFLCNYAF